MSLVQRINLKFSVKLKKTLTELLKMLQEAYKDQAMSHARVLEWHQRFRKGEDYKLRFGRPSKTDENVAAVKQAVRED